VNTTIDIMPMLLLVLFSLALSTGAAMVIFVLKRARLPAVANPLDTIEFEHTEAGYGAQRKAFMRRPTCWLAVKGRNMFAVQSALKLHNPKRCSWMEGFSGEEKLFIAPPVKGWILVLGSRLPEPSDDVDACFRFIQALSKKLGQVQFFSVSRILNHHAWVRAERGRIVRAYAWAGRTIWTQGARTPAEKDLDLHCFDYWDQSERATFAQPEGVVSNVDKVPLLAARWSLDPGTLEERFLEREHGIGGELSRGY